MQIRITVMRSRIRIKVKYRIRIKMRIKVKSRIRIRINVKCRILIRNTAFTDIKAPEEASVFNGKSMKIQGTAFPVYLSRMVAALPGPQGHHVRELILRPTALVIETPGPFLLQQFLLQDF